MRLFVTTSMHPKEKHVLEAKELAIHLGTCYIERNKMALSHLFEKTSLDEAIVVTKEEWKYVNKGGHTFFFHPGASILRIHQLKQGKKDTLIEVGKIQEGDHVLDCTLGMGADAIVLSFVVGAYGKIVALESERILYTLVSHGLKHYSSEKVDVMEAMRRIDVVYEDHKKYLQMLPDRSFDTLLFDPMFNETIPSSSGIQALKPLSNQEPLQKEIMEEAKRVARRNILFKERTKSKEWERLGFSIKRSGSRFGLGVIDVKD